MEQRAIQATMVNENGEVVIYDEKSILMEAADKILGDCLENGNLFAAGQALQRFRSLSNGAAMAAAKLLHGVNFRWKEFEHEEWDTFILWAIRETGYDGVTIARRVAEWEFLTGGYIPGHLLSQFEEYTVRQLDKAYSICVTTKPNKRNGNLDIINQDYDIEPAQWLELSEAADEQMVAEVVREIKGKERNTNAMSLILDDDGTLWVYQGNKSETIGHLFVGKEDEMIQKAIRRIVDNCGIKDREEY